MMRLYVALRMIANVFRFRRDFRQTCPRCRVAPKIVPHADVHANASVWHPKLEPVSATPAPHQARDAAATPKNFLNLWNNVPRRSVRKLLDTGKLARVLPIACADIHRFLAPENIKPHIIQTRKTRRQRQLRSININDLGSSLARRYAPDTSQVRAILVQVGLVFQRVQHPHGVAAALPQGLFCVEVQRVKRRLCAEVHGESRRVRCERMRPLPSLYHNRPSAATSNVRPAASTEPDGRLRYPRFDVARATVYLRRHSDEPCNPLRAFMSRSVFRAALPCPSRNRGCRSAGAAQSRTATKRTGT